MTALEYAGRSPGELADLISGNPGVALQVAIDAIQSKARVDELEEQLGRERERADMLVRSLLPPTQPEYGWRGLVRRVSVPLAFVVGGMAFFVIGTFALQRFAPGWCG